MPALQVQRNVVLCRERKTMLLVSVSQRESEGRRTDAPLCPHLLQRINTLNFNHVRCNYICKRIICLRVHSTPFKLALLLCSALWCLYSGYETSPVLENTHTAICFNLAVWLHIWAYPQEQLKCTSTELGEFKILQRHRASETWHMACYLGGIQLMTLNFSPVFRNESLALNWVTLQRNI